jgi:type II secretory pathway component GspD/PulD (secretin)
MQTKPFAFPKNIALNAAALALASGLLTASSAIAAPVTAAPHTVRAMTSSTDDVTLDFVSADINDVLKALAMQTRSNIVSGSDVKGTITVSLAHVSLEEALDLITKLSGYQYAKIGKTYLVGSPTAIQTLTANGSAQSPAVTGVIAFSYSDSADLINELKQLYPNLKTTPGKSAGGQAGGGVLVVTGTPEDVESARRMISDSESVLSKNIQASRTQVYNIKYANAEDLQVVLSRLVPGIIVTPGPVQRTYAPAPTTADAGGVTTTTTSIGSGVAAGGAITSVTGNLPTKLTTTALLLTGSDADLTRALQVLATIDLRPAQINFEARITEINLNKADHLGLTYDFSGASTRLGELKDNVTGGPPVLGDNGYPGKNLKLGTFARTALSNFVDVKLNALFQSGDAKLLSSPNISAIDGQPAAVFVGDSITYVSSVTTGPTGQNITTATVNAGIKLLVTGKINNDGFVTMNIHPEVSTPTFLPSIGGAVLPRISTREATTTLRVRDGETIAIGGLISESDVKNISKVPFFGDLPFFGQLFRDSQTAHTRNEIVIFVKVSIQKDAV